jgi:hypothetical protein
MAGLVPAIHVLSCSHVPGTRQGMTSFAIMSHSMSCILQSDFKYVDGRDKPGHDAWA